MIMADFKKVHEKKGAESGKAGFAPFSSISRVFP